MNLLTQFPQFKATAAGTGRPQALNDMLDEIGQGETPQQQMARMLDEMTRMAGLVTGGTGRVPSFQSGVFGANTGADLLGVGAGLPGFSPQFSGYSPAPTSFQLPFSGQSPFGSGEPRPNQVPPQGPAGASAFGQSIFRAITQYAAKNPPPRRHRCYEWVAKALDRVGVHLQGRSAYMAADQLARNPKFREVKMSKDQLPSLSPGAIVVWAGSPRTAGHGHGHISIATGDGRELSDRYRKQLTNYGPSFRVFLPQ